jgi:hypothetical protein
MANVTISGLYAAAALTGTEEVPIVQSGSTVRTTTQDIANLGGGGGVMAAGSGCCSIQGSGCNNIASGCFSFVGGGCCNTVSGYSSFLGGGICNNTVGDYSFIGGGQSIVACGNSATAVGGRENIANSPFYPTVVGGRNNTASGNYSFVGGGFQQTASGNYSFAAGGSSNTAQCNYTGVFGCNLCNTQSCTFMSNNFVVGDFVSSGGLGCNVSIDASGKMCLQAGGGGASYTSYVSEVSGDPTVSATVFENTTGLTFTWASGLNIDYTSYTTTISSVDPAKIAIFLTGEIIIDTSKGITARYTTPSYLITTVNPTTATIEIVYDGISNPVTFGAAIMVEVRIYP